MLYIRFKTVMTGKKTRKIGSSEILGTELEFFHKKVIKKFGLRNVFPFPKFDAKSPPRDTLP